MADFDDDCLEMMPFGLVDLSEEERACFAEGVCSVRLPCGGLSEPSGLSPSVWAVSVAAVSAMIMVMGWKAWGGREDGCS